ncbi:prepilin-type N-terminal cleavage/methylation domain-containing protein [Candidatus Nomurabacteria bacterium]|nr:MAG: prepilin-type N-terminal cleavage/methylation domain-containing protein [Candidatus Nomurabacteria bacterium]
MKKDKYTKGFTLLELLIVIVIIGLLSAIIMGALNSARANSRDSKDITELKSVVNALNLYFSTNGYYPAVATSLVPTYIPVMPSNIYYTGLSGSAGQCASYHVGVSLEKNNVVLNTDRDLLSTTAGLVGTGYTNLCGNTNGLNASSIRGDDAQSCKGTVVEPAGGKCFDLVP